MRPRRKCWRSPASAGENELLATTLTQLDALRMKLTELALDGGFRVAATNDALNASAQQPAVVAIAGTQEPSSPRTRRRLYCYRSGAEGRISHLKRGHGLRRSRLRGHDGQRAWCGWAILAYNLDTHTVRLN